jgi:hypothetical protein
MRRFFNLHVLCLGIFFEVKKLTSWGMGGGRYMQSNAFTQLMGDKCLLSLQSDICISVFDYARLAAFLPLKSDNASGAMFNQAS